MTRLLWHDQSVPRGSDGAIHYSDIIGECRRKKFNGASQWLLEDWISTLAKGGGEQKRFQFCLNPNSSNQILYLRAILGHEGDNAIDPALQDNVLLPKGFTEYLHHVGNASEVNSMVRNRWIPGGKSFKRGRQAVFFTTLNPMDDGCGMWETPRDPSKPRIAPYKNTWKRLQNMVCWCNLKLAQEKGLWFFQTRSHAVVLYNTLPAACIEIAVCMKTQDALYPKRVPHVVLKSNSQHGQQDLQNQDARSSWEPSSDSKSYGETCNNTVDYRISGVPLSADEQQDTTRENKVKNLIENHKHKESFLQDLSQAKKINKFSKESQDLIADMNNTEIFEHCENSSKQQCPDCNAYWEIGIVFCSGRNLKSSQRPKRVRLEQPWRPLNPLICDQEKQRKTAVVEWSTDLQKDKECTIRRQMLKRARQKKHRSHPTILARWYASETYRDSLSEIGWREKLLKLYDRIALVKHICVATRAERIQNSKHRILTINAEGPQQPLNQRPNFAQAKRECKRLHDEHLTRTQQDYGAIPRSQQVRQRKEQQFEATKNMTAQVTRKQVGSSTKGTSSGSRANLQTASSSSSTWDQTHWKTSNWSSQHSSSPDDWWILFPELGQVSDAWRKTSRRCEQYTHKIQHVQSCTAWSHFIARTRVAQELQSPGLHISVSLKQWSSTCHVSFLAAPDSDHTHKFFLTHLIYFSYLSDSLTSTNKIYDSRPIFTVRCSTAEWRITTSALFWSLPAPPPRVQLG